MSSLITIASLEAKISAIEQLESNGPNLELKSKLLMLKRERNAFTPFCAVPDEIVGRILIALMIEPENPFGFFETDAFLSSPKWGRVMRVCSRIRTVALHTPQLWSIVDCQAHSFWIKLCIQRACSCPLTVKYMDLGREEVLHLTSSLIRMASALQLAIGNFAALGRKLELDFATPNAQSSLRALQVSGDSFARVFKALIPAVSGSWDHLVELTLARIVLSPPRFMFNGLLRLRLRGIKCAENDYSIVFDFLRSTPLLEVFEAESTGLRNVRNTYWRWVPVLRNGPTISLPHLRVVSLTEDPPTVLLLLEALPSPSQVISVSRSFYWNQLHIPFKRHQLSHSPPINPHHRDEAEILIRLRAFWHENSGPGLMPAGHLILSSEFELMEIHYGMPISTTTSVPSVYYTSYCEIGGPDPFFDTVNTVQMILEFSQEMPERTGIACMLRSIDKGKIGVAHIVIEYMEECPASRAFEAWLRARLDTSRSARPTLHYAGRIRSDVEKWATRLVEEGLVEMVKWSPGLYIRR